jgi:hypothetical protein
MFCWSRRVIITFRFILRVIEPCDVSVIHVKVLMLNALEFTMTFRFHIVDVIWLIFSTNFVNICMVFDHFSCRLIAMANHIKVAYCNQ